MTNSPEPRRSGTALPHQNGVTRPNAATITGRVWNLVDELQAALGKLPARSEVIGKGLAQGINEATLSTQYGRWRKFHGFTGRTNGPAVPARVAVVPEAEAIEQRVIRKLSNQVVGNAGLYYVCYRLSLDGWNVMPTARNARGIDIIAYGHNGQNAVTVQVKALSKPGPVPLGSGLDNLIGKYFVVCRRVLTSKPESYVLTPGEVRQRAHRGVKDGKVSYWLQPKSYEEFFERWDRIGSGCDR
jgi:hypothetical protein